MKTKLFFMLAAAALVLCACGNKQHQNEIPENFVTKPGDKTLYGLACDCNDSIIEVLPYDLSDPKTYDITKAWKNNAIYGMPKTGDNIAIVLTEDGKSVEKLINLDLLKGKWCYMEVPTLRRPAAMNDNDFAKLEAYVRDSLNDSIRQEMFAPIEYGLEFNDDKTISFIGRMHKESDETGIQLAEYRRPRMYAKWEIFNGELILTKMGKKELKDTIDFKIIKQDSLVLLFDDGEQSYYRKKNEASIDEIDKNKATNKTK